MAPLGDKLIEGADYIYTFDKPEGCCGQRYRLHRFVVDVPSYQHKCLVEALTGRDAGLLFTVSMANFAVRYRLAEVPTSKEGGEG